VLLTHNFSTGFVAFIPTLPVSALITKAGVVKLLFPTAVEGVISKPASTLS